MNVRLARGRWASSHVSTLELINWRWLSRSGVSGGMGRRGRLVVGLDAGTRHVKVRCEGQRAEPQCEKLSLYKILYKYYLAYTHKLSTCSVDCVYAIVYVYAEHISNRATRESRSRCERRLRVRTAGYCNYRSLVVFTYISSHLSHSLCKFRSVSLNCANLTGFGINRSIPDAIASSCVFVSAQAVRAMILVGWS